MADGWRLACISGSASSHARLRSRAVRRHQNATDRRPRRRVAGPAAEAFAHLERADELITGDPHGYLNFEFDTVRSLVSLEAGRAEAAHRAAMAGLSFSSGVPPDLCEFLVPLASRALADLAEAARDARMDDSVLLAELEVLVQRFPNIVTGPGQPTPLMITQRAAMTAGTRPKSVEPGGPVNPGSSGSRLPGSSTRVGFPGWRCTPGAEPLRLYWAAADRREPKGGVP